MQGDQQRIDFDFFELFIIKNWDIEVLKNIIEAEDED